MHAEWPRYPHGLDGKESACNAGDPGLILGWGRSPEKGMATHSSILAWEIPWIEESGLIQSMELERVRLILVTKQQQQQQQLPKDNLIIVFLTKPQVWFS